MSVENAKKFFEACKAGDEDAKSLLSAESKEGTLLGIEETVKKVNDAGWDFTVEDAKQAYLESQPEGELSEAELNTMAGGCDEGCDSFFRVCDDTHD